MPRSQVKQKAQKKAKKSLTCLFSFIYVQDAELCVAFFNVFFPHAFSLYSLSSRHL